MSRFHHISILLFLSLLLILGVAPVFSYAQSASNIDALLKTYFEEHPQADYNVDGKLTKSEASRHRKTQDIIAKQGKRLKGMPKRRFAHD